MGRTGSVTAQESPHWRQVATGPLGARLRRRRSSATCSRQAGLDSPRPLDVWTDVRTGSPGWCPKIERVHPANSAIWGHNFSMAEPKTPEWTEAQRLQIEEALIRHGTAPAVLVGFYRSLERSSDPSIVRRMATWMPLMKPAVGEALFNPPIVASPVLRPYVLELIGWVVYVALRNTREGPPIGLGNYACLRDALVAAGVEKGHCFADAIQALQSGSRIRFGHDMLQRAAGPVLLHPRTLSAPDLRAEVIRCIETTATAYGKRAQPDFELGMLINRKKLNLDEAQAVRGLLDLNSGSPPLG